METLNAAFGPNRETILDPNTSATKIREEPFPQWPFYGRDEIEAVADILKSGKVNYWTGNHGNLLANEFADYCGTKYAIPVSNGTTALELALYALGIEPGDEVIVTPRTFIASISCIVMRGATPVFADVDPNSQNITADTIQQVLTDRTKAIVAVHLAGWPCDMDPIMDLAREKNLKVIEDCAQAHGAEYKGKKVGSLGHAAAFSFCTDKIISSGGEGGMLLTQDQAVWDRAWSFKDHGRDYKAVHKDHPPGFRWVCNSFGTNWRMPEIQAVIARRQLTKLPEWLKQRRRNAELLTECFDGIPALRVTRPPSTITHAYYKYYVFLRPERLRPSWGQNEIVQAINDEGIPCFHGSCSEVYMEKAFDKTSWRPPERLPISCELGKKSLMFLVHPTLGGKEMDDTCKAVTKVLSIASI